jgi:hypothetical protein
MECGGNCFNEQGVMMRTGKYAVPTIAAYVVLTVLSTLMAVSVSYAGDSRGSFRTRVPR